MTFYDKMDTKSGQRKFLWYIFIVSLLTWGILLRREYDFYDTASPISHFSSHSRSKKLFIYSFYSSRIDVRLYINIIFNIRLVLLLKIIARILSIALQFHIIIFFLFFYILSSFFLLYYFLIFIFLFSFRVTAKCPFFFNDKLVVECESKKIFLEYTIRLEFLHRFFHPINFIYMYEII